MERGPGCELAQFLNAWRRHQSAAVGTAAARIGLCRKLERVKNPYLDGATDRTEYWPPSLAALDELAALPPGANPDDDAGKCLAGDLAGVASARRVATPAERNRPARTRFSGGAVADRTALAVVPRPDLRPFLADNPLAESCTGGSDGLRSRGCMIPRAARAFADLPQRRRAERSRRDAYQAPGARRLSPEQEEALRRAALGRSLRDLAAEFGVSHESVRAALRVGAAAAA